MSNPTNDEIQKLIEEALDEDLEARISSYLDRNLQSKHLTGASILASKVRGGPGAGLAPTGSVFDWVSSTTPEGYLHLDGALISQETYPGLFELFGANAFGTDTATHFYLPDATGRVIVGEGGLVGADTLGDTAGAETHTLTEAELAVHDHTDNFTLPSHQHRTWATSSTVKYRNISDDGSGYNVLNITGGSNWNPLTNTPTSTPAIDGAVQNAGSGNAHNNMPPYLILHKIIKT